MTKASTIAELNGFLANHESVAKPIMYDIGSRIGEWRVTAFLGSGGNSEVYRVVRDADGTIAAAKVLVRDDEASKKRFRQEATLLSDRNDPYFAKFYGSGEDSGRLYIVTELLEPVDLPDNEKDIAEYILNVCNAASVLHRSGLVHRDIKPSNVMRRENGELVLIDLGLVKDVVKSPLPEKDVSLVSGKAIAVGTPRFAAPEQLTGDEVTSAADVHAIGRLADVAFGSNPPRSWLTIIRRATSSIPDKRYSSVDALARAIRCRNTKRRATETVAASFTALLLVGIGSIFWRSEVKPALVWNSMCENVTTNLVAYELARECLVTNKVGNLSIVTPERTYRRVDKKTAATLVQLRNRTNEFEMPLVLDASREYFIEGPGILAADIRSDSGKVRVHLKNCFILNRSPVPINEAGIHYIFEGGVYLNFVQQDELPRSIVSAHIEGFDGAYDKILFKGPVKEEDLRRAMEKESRRMLELDTQTFFKKFHFPCHIWTARTEYSVENMEETIYKKYGIDPDRVRTEAEIALFAEVFEISVEEARRIIMKAGHKCLGTTNCVV